MLQKTTSIMIVFALSTLVLPVGASDATEEQEYGAALGAREGVTGEDHGLGLYVYPDPEICHLCPGVPPMGGVNLSPSILYEHVDLHIDDAVFDQPASFVCFYNPHGDNLCDEDDHVVGMGCGIRSFHDVPFGSEMGTVFLYSLYVAPSLEVCMTSTGTVRATFY